MRQIVIVVSLLSLAGFSLVQQTPDLNSILKLRKANLSSNTQAFDPTRIDAGNITTESSIIKNNTQNKTENINKLEMRNFFLRTTLNAPEFHPNTEWLNTDEPITLESLKGKIVLLDFWTYCCINCIHIVPELAKLEEKYPNELVVIGIHSAKFTNEKDKNSITEAIGRYGIRHPVANDKDFKIWRSYAIQAWPTTVLIDPEGKIVADKSGEMKAEEYIPVIDQLLKLHADKIDRKKSYLKAKPSAITPQVPLSYPGKIAVDGVSQQLFISDSAHNRIVISDFYGEVREIIGSGKVGLKDGSFTEAEFNEPQGLAFYRSYLFVADRKNHAIRKIDFKNKTVETIAGTGQQGAERRPRGPGKEISLISPWDILPVGDNLFIAMAGSHQIWVLDIRDNRIKLHAGSGIENITDAPLLLSALAQPSGLTSDGKKLFFADSEVSAVRTADIDTNGEVKTLIGSGLFDFGDTSGDFKKAELQHPLGLTYHDNKIYLADTYNNKIKVLDLDKKKIETLAGTGEAGMKDGTFKEATFNEPAGLTFYQDKLYVADTNNGLIRILDLKTTKVSTLVFKNVETLFYRANVKNKHDEFLAPRTTKEEVYDIAEKQFKNISSVNLAKLKAITFSFSLPEGFKINPLAPNQLKVVIKNFNKTKSGLADAFIEREIKEENSTIDLPINPEAKQVYAEASVYFCRKDNAGLCHVKDIAWKFLHDSQSTTSEYLTVKETLETPKN